MPRLRLGLYRLPVVEVVVVQTIVRLSAQNASFPWKLVDTPPYDALLIDGTLIDDQLAEVERMASTVLTLTRTNSEGLANTLQRPIRAEKLQQWLLNTGRELLEMRRRTLPTTTNESTAMTVELPDSVCYSLRRWPPAAVVGNDMDNVQMANLLLRHELNASELADLSGQSVSRCVGFLQALRNAGVVEVHVRSDGPGETEWPMASQPGSAGGKGPARGLLDGLRRRLGLRAP